MALLGSFTKQPGETLPIDISFSSVVGGRTTTAITSVITVPSGMTQTGSAIQSGESLQIYVAGGTSGQSYPWKVVTTITIGGRDTIIEDEFDVVVLEV
ncbi:MAG: hypothetical protein IPN11_14555 [Opitutaceae bacterium]|nr:hypothetical protein [Opitutaceae bacterium]